jgi:hypothetical protein
LFARRSKGKRKAGLNRLELFNLSVKLRSLHSDFLRHVRIGTSRVREPDLECWSSLGMSVKTRLPASPAGSGLSANSVICNSRLIPRISKRRQGCAAFGAGWQKGGDEDR